MTVPPLPEAVPPGQAPVPQVEGLPVQGVLLRTFLLQGRDMTLMRIEYRQGSATPRHLHSHESMIYVMRGKIRSTVGDEVRMLGPDDFVRHPANVLHRVEALEDSLVLEVKSPALDIRAVLGA